MKLRYILILSVILLTQSYCLALHMPSSSPIFLLQKVKRALQGGICALPLLLSSSVVTTPAAHATDNTVTETRTMNTIANSKSHHHYYFGLGCFWHIQHEFVNAESQLLQRPPDQLTVSELHSYYILHTSPDITPLSVHVVYRV